MTPKERLAKLVEDYKNGVVSEDIAQHMQKSRGLGDTIAKVTKAVGIKPCGRCKKRQKLLNEMFPYKGATSSETSGS